MSASAFIIAENEAVFLSDGVTYSGSRIHSENGRKVWKLRESTALIWMGTRTNAIHHIVNSVKGCDAETAIHTVAGILKSGLTSDIVLTALATSPFNIFTFEARDGFVQYWRLFYYEDKFTPVFKGNLYPGNTGALVVDRENPPFPELIREYQTADKSAETVGLEAFEEMIRRYKMAGVRVGGKTFVEKITSDLEIPKSPHETSYLMDTPG